MTGKIEPVRRSSPAIGLRVRQVRLGRLVEDVLWIAKEGALDQGAATATGRGGEPVAVEVAAGDSEPIELVIGDAADACVRTLDGVPSGRHHVELALVDGGDVEVRLQGIDSGREFTQILRVGDQ
jgi:hypothetical protein